MARHRCGGVAGAADGARVQALLGFGGQHAVFDWKPELGTSVRVLALDGSGVVRQFSMPPWFSYHFVNAFETDDAALGRCVGIDVPMATDATSIDSLYLSEMRDRSNDIPPIQLKCVPLPPSPPSHTPRSGLHRHGAHA